jgi:hypothetical protein
LNEGEIEVKGSKTREELVTEEIRANSTHHSSVDPELTKAMTKISGGSSEELFAG